jgi:mitogen-activated protein kinase kinase kinase
MLKAIEESTPNNLKGEGYFTKEEEKIVKEMMDLLEEKSNAKDGEKKKRINPESKGFKWKDGDLLGMGSFGRVYQAMEIESQLFMAIKEVVLPENSKESIQIALDLQREIRILQKYAHPNIVKYYGVKLSNNTIKIFMEYMSGGSLAKNIAQYGKIPETGAKRYTKQILEGLLYLHYNKIVHRDIKGANILLAQENSRIKLADFGCAKEIAQNKTYHESMKGTANWMAPEIIKQTGGGRFSDIWSLGCTVYEMLVGKPPWHHLNNQFSVLYHVASGEEPPTIPEELKLSDLAKDFIFSCLRYFYNSHV